MGEAGKYHTGKDYQKELKKSKHRLKKIILFLTLILLPVLRYGISIPFYNTTVTIDISDVSFFVLWCINLFILSIIWLDALSYESFKAKLKFREEIDQKEEHLKRNMENIASLKKLLENNEGDASARIKELSEISENIDKELEEIQELRKQLSPADRITLFFLKPIDVLKHGEIRRSLLITLTIVYIILLFHNKDYGEAAVNSITWVYRCEQESSYPLGLR